MRAWIVNQYGEKLVELSVEGDDEFVISEGEWDELYPIFLSEGDSWTVKVER